MAPVSTVFRRHVKQSRFYSSGRNDAIVCCFPGGIENGTLEFSSCESGFKFRERYTNAFLSIAYTVVMITVVEGKPGMGKTVWMTAEILRWLRRGEDVYTNIEIKDQRILKKYYGHLYYIESLEDIIKLRRGKIILDEVQTYLNSRNWSTLDIRFQLLLQQHRKRGLDIIGATQSIKRADVVFRELVQVFYRIRKIAAFRIPYTTAAFGFFYLREYDPDETIESSGVKSNQNAIGWPIPFVADPFLFSVYDTTQEYEPATAEGQTVIETYVISKKSSEVKQLIGKRVVDAGVSPE